MCDAEDSLPPSKKRAAGRELNRDKPELDDEEDTSEAEGTFKRASNEVLASRRIVKVRRNQNTSSAPSSNPFAAILLIPPSADSTTKPVDVASAAPIETSAAVKAEAKDTPENQSESKVEKAEAKSKSKVDTEEGNEKDNQQPEKKKVESGEGETESTVEKMDTVAADKKETDEAPKPDQGDEDVPKNNESAASVGSFQQLSSTKNAFTGFSGIGFSTASTFSFGLAPKDGSSSDQSSPFSFSIPANGNSSLFSGSSTVSKPEGSSFPSKDEVVVETGEENEKVVFSADSILFEFTDSSWKERGKGEIKVNVSTESEKARLVMRTKGNYRLILNASLYPEMKLTNMEKKGITFACVNSATEEGKNSNLVTFAAKFKDPIIVESFRESVNSHKGKEKSELLKTPENSPKALED